MEARKLNFRSKIVLRAIVCATVAGSLLLAVPPATEVGGTPPISGQTISFGAGSDLGASTDAVYSLASGDLDNDGDPDIVSVSASGEDYEVVSWENNGAPFSGLWSQNDVGASIDHVLSVALGDLDDDGDLDIVSGSYSGEDYELIAWENSGSPFSGLWPQNDVGSSADNVRCVALGDLDSDGDLDIVSGSYAGEDYELIAWENDGSPFTDLWPQNDIGAGADDVTSVALGDLDDDGDLDVVSGSWDGKVTGWENDGSPFTDLWAQNDLGLSASGVLSVALGDLDHDGDLDIVSGSDSGEDYEVIAWENDGSPFVDPWAQHDVGPSTDMVRLVALGDLDGDGDLDVVSGSYSAEDCEVIAWQNDGSPFTDPWLPSDVGASADSVYWVLLDDLDKDGDLDIASGSGAAEDYEIIAWPNTLVHRNMPFDPLGSLVADTGWVSSVALGDLDDDGDIDIVSQWGVGARAWENDGTPFIDLWSYNSVGDAPTTIISFALGDLDNDGDLDIAAGSWAHAAFYDLFVWENDGTPFTDLWPQNEVGDVSSAYSVTLGDLDDDGDLDIVCGSRIYETYQVIAWENDGTPFSDAWARHDVGNSTDTVGSLALGDLDNDGDLDIVSGSYSGEDYELIAWENNGSPFTDLWSQSDVGASADTVMSVAVGDLDNDGDLDIVSGSYSGEDYELIAWANDGSPFTDLWSQSDVGAGADDILSLALGDLDNDGDLDIVSGGQSGADYQVVTWRNDGSPFSGLWSQDDVGSGIGGVRAVPLGDLDSDGDLDIVSGGDADGFPYKKIIAWRNRGGSADEVAADSAPSTICCSQTAKLLRTVVTHNGSPGDNDIELTEWSLLFEETTGDPLTTAEANNIIENLYVYVSADRFWRSTDTVVTTISTLSLNSGVQTITFSDGDANVQIPQGTSRTYFVVAQLKDTACDETPNTFQLSFDPDSGSLVEDRAEDVSVSIEDSETTSTGSIKITCDRFVPLVLKGIPYHCDDFSDPNSGWYVADTANVKYSYVAGQYEILLRNKNWMASVAAPTRALANGSVEADALLHSGTEGSYGLVFGLSDWDHFYLFIVDPGIRYYSLWRAEPSGWVPVVEWHYSLSIRRYTVNHLEVERNGNEIALWVNGHLLTEINDGTYTGTLYTGLSALSWDEQPIAVRFDNFCAQPSGAAAQLGESSVTELPETQEGRGPIPAPPR